jgi:hypothetical protein
MHRFVLEDREHGLRAVKQWITGTIEIAALQRRAHSAIGFRGELLDGCA